MLELVDIGKTVALAGGHSLTVVHDASLTITAGESVAILGRSGSGKSTLLGLLGLLDSPSGGSYRIDGVETDRLGDAALARLRARVFGFVYQRFCLMANLDALHNVEAPLLYSGERGMRRRRAAALEALERVGLAERATHRPHQLSGGEQQRVAVARALVHRPRVILADEPTGSLDMTTGREVLSTLLGLVRQDGATLVMVTHDPEIAARLDRTMLMDDGRLREIA